jgi:hypothetical protein
MLERIPNAFEKHQESKKQAPMAKVTLHPMIKDIHGRLGGYVFRHTYAGELTIIKRADMSNVKWSQAQEAQHQRFKEAVAYAKAAMAEPKVRAKYEKAATKQGKRPYDLAKSDYCKGRDLLTPNSR